MMDDFIIKLIRVVLSSLKKASGLAIILLAIAGVVSLVIVVIKALGTEGGRVGLYVSVFLYIFPVYVVFVGHYLGDIFKYIGEVIDGAVVEWSCDEMGRNDDEATKRLMCAVTHDIIRIRLRRAGLFMTICVIIWSDVFFYDYILCLFFAGISALLVADAGLVYLGVKSQEFGSNSYEMMEVFDFLVRQKRSGGGPSGGYKEVYDDLSHSAESINVSNGVGVRGA
ncbi:hypothetical protein [Paramagnetospirillum kuznetsovii]|uniref:hypothetical protein n=1 Tax=Paramagnetospirillum kuznetsovii TaxID=2053833 RepID=UPI001374D804|nr:hypothetical protein [Paramagnetospirillum kuznetsovii]